MPRFALIKEMEETHAAYNKCAGELSRALTEAKAVVAPPAELMQRIKSLNQQCDELLDLYMSAYKEYYGAEVTDK